MTNPPRSLRIGPYRYSLRVDDAAVINYYNETGKVVGAFTDLQAHAMTFASGSASPHVVIHEALHVLADHSGLDVRLGDGVMEDVIQSFDHGLAALIRFNPSLVRYIME